MAPSHGSDFTYDVAGDIYLCPGGKTLTTTGTRVNDDATLLYRASNLDCEGCALKSKCCPNSTGPQSATLDPRRRA